MTETETAVDPASLYGNPARQYPVKVLLDLDAAFAGEDPPQPPSLPHGGAGPQDPAMHDAAYQEWNDWKGVVEKVMIIQSTGKQPTDTQLKQIAFSGGVSFTYRGGSYFNKADGGVYIPG